MRINPQLFPVMSGVKITGSAASLRGTDDPIITVSLAGCPKFPVGTLKLTRATGAGGVFRYTNPFLHPDSGSIIDETVGGGQLCRYLAMSIWAKRYSASAVNNPGLSNIVSRTASTCKKPVAPNGSSDGLFARLTLSVVSNQVVVTFVDNSTVETGFSLERSVDGGSTWPVVYTLAARSATGGVTYTDTAVVSGITYTYRVKAVRSDSAKDSAYCYENSISF